MLTGFQKFGSKMIEKRLFKEVFSKRDLHLAVTGAGEKKDLAFSVITKNVPKAIT